MIFHWVQIVLRVVDLVSVLFEELLDDLDLIFVFLDEGILLRDLFTLEGLVVKEIDAQFLLKFIEDFTFGKELFWFEV